MEQAPATDKQPTGLSAKQVQAVYALASGTSKKATAKALEVEPHTLTRWGQLPAFRALLAKVTSHLEAESQQALTAQKLKALDTLSELMDESQPAQVRLSAARAALELQTPAPPEDPASSYEEFMKHFGQGLTHASNAKHQH
ncbi:hypothetical protein [Diaphorobacter nitroreducens]|nr:hypothetical protein [Diaphorobacter nitroreducens]